MQTQIIKFSKLLENEVQLAGVSFLIASLIFVMSFSFIAFGQDSSGETLTVTVLEAMTFTTDVSGFGDLTPGTPKYATTTTNVVTNSGSGFNLTLSGDDQGTTDTVMDLTTDDTVGITDQEEWVAGAATTTAGNAVLVGALDNSGDVLAFRMMTASGTAEVISTSWWGADDTAGNALWAGIASSTVERQIGNSSVYSSSAAVNTVQYYLDVPASQQTGSYDGGVTYTATANI